MADKPIGNRPAMLLYLDTWTDIKKEYTEEEAGKLIFAAIDYENSRTDKSIEAPYFEQRDLRREFERITADLDRDAKKYAQNSNYRIEAGRIGGIKSGQVRKAKAEKKKQAKQTKQTLQETVSVDISSEPQTFDYTATRSNEANEPITITTSITNPTTESINSIITHHNEPLPVKSIADLLDDDVKNEELYKHISDTDFLKVVDKINEKMKYRSWDEIINPYSYFYTAANNLGVYR